MHRISAVQKFARLASLFLVIALLAGSWAPGGAAPAGLTASTAGAFPDGSYPSALVYGPRSLAQTPFWLALRGSNQVGSFVTSPALVTDTFSAPTAAAGLHDLTIGPDQQVWFTERVASSIGRYDPQGGGFSEYPLPPGGGDPTAITLGQDGALWFTEMDSNRIGRITPDGEVTQINLPSAGSWPLGIVTAPDGSIWFTEWNGKRIGKISPLGELAAEYALPDPLMRPREIVVGPDGNLWFTEEIGKKIGQVNPQTGEIQVYNLAALAIGSTSLADIAVGPDGKLWFLGFQSVGRFDVTPSGPANLEDTPIASFGFQGDGRSQLIAGPGAEMYYITLDTQNVYTVTAGEVPTWRDVQVFINHLPPQLLAGGEFEMVSEAVNWSAAPATDVSLTLTLDANIQFIRADTAASTLSCTDLGGEVVCPLGDLAGGTGLPVTYTLETALTGSEPVALNLALSVSAAESDYLPANNRLFRSPTLHTTLDYFYDFTDGADAHWSHTTTSSPNSELTYLGVFDNDIVQLSFDDLPPHDRLWMCFEQYVLGGWDGSHIVEPVPVTNPPVIGPDLWAYYLDENRMLMTSFSNRPNLSQAYPQNYPLGENPAQSRSVTGDFDLDPAVLDARYTLCFREPHTTADLIATFQGLGLDSFSGEGWALDNVHLMIYYAAAVNDLNRLYLPVLVW